MPSSPGPWTVEEDITEGLFLNDSNGEPIATVFESDDAYLMASAHDLATQLAEAVALLRRAHEHITYLEPLTGNCDHPDCGHAYCADVVATNAERGAIILAIDAALLAKVDGK